MSNRGGSPGGRSGSSTDGGTCATNGGCHGPKTPSSEELISTSVPAQGYIPGARYSIKVSAKRNNIFAWGFEMMCEDSEGDPIGKFDTTGNKDVNGLQDMIRVTHKFASSFSTDSVSWTVDWIAPDAGTGDVDIYCAVLAANNSGTTGGDNVIIDTLRISENTSVSVTKLENLEAIIYPNPTSDFVIINTKLSPNSQVQLIDVNGNEVINRKVAKILDLKSLPSGSYFLRIIDGTRVYSKKITKL